jgi:hypothetical protein
MKSIKIALLCVSLAANLSWGGCASFTRRNEVEVQVPEHDQVVRDQIPAEGGRKIPVVRTYSP